MNESHSETSEAAWIQATYRDCGIQQPTIWLNTTSHYIESPSATWGI